MKNERKLAVKIYDTISVVKKEIAPGPLEDLKTKAVAHLTEYGFKTDYVEIADASNLYALLEYWDGITKLVVLVAGYLNDIRLIDNMVLD